MVRRVRRRCLSERTVVVDGDETSRSRSGMEVEKRMVRRRGRGCLVDVEAFMVAFREVAITLWCRWMLRLICE